MKSKIVIVGSSNTDMVVRVDHFPQPGETLLGTDFMTAQGGKGANQAVAVARLGGEATFVCCLGNDAFGQQTLGQLKQEGQAWRKYYYCGIGSQCLIVRAGYSSCRI